MESVVNSSDSYGNTYQVPLTDLRWRPGAYGIVVHDGNVLLSPQFDDNTYDLPGGGVEIGETLEQAVVREVKEETGLDVASPSIISAASSFFTFKDDEGIDHVQALLLYFHCQLVGGELSTEGFDEYEKDYARLAVWFPIDQLDSIQVASSNDWRPIVKKVAAHANTRD